MKHMLYLLFIALFFMSCTVEEISEKPVTPTPEEVSILFLGDSYTIGQSVCETCRYPVQLVDSLKKSYEETTFEFDIVAKTGWTTSSLLTAIEQANLADSYDYVYLLIGVNNQYQNNSFSVYEEEFVELLNIALEKVGDNQARVNVVSIPDYAFTPFGMNGSMNVISDAIDKYNNYALQESTNAEVEFINITDISRRGIEEPTLVASDGLHPSTQQYGLWVERLYPIIVEELF